MYIFNRSEIINGKILFLIDSVGSYSDMVELHYVNSGYISFKNNGISYDLI